MSTSREAGDVSPSPPPPACLLQDKNQRSSRDRIDVVDNSDDSNEEGEVTESTPRSRNHEKARPSKSSSSRSAPARRHRRSSSPPPGSRKETEALRDTDGDTLTESSPSTTKDRDKSKHKDRGHRHSRKHSSRHSSSKHRSSSRHGKSSDSSSSSHKRKHSESLKKTTDHANGVNETNEVVEVVELSSEVARERKGSSSKAGRPSVLVDLTDNEEDAPRPSKRHKSEEAEIGKKASSGKKATDERGPSRRNKKDRDSSPRHSLSRAKKSDKKRTRSRSQSKSRRDSSPRAKKSDKRRSRSRSQSKSRRDSSPKAKKGDKKSSRSPSRSRRDSSPRRSSSRAKKSDKTRSRSPLRRADGDTKKSSRGQLERDRSRDRDSKKTRSERDSSRGRDRRTSREKSSSDFDRALRDHHSSDRRRGSSRDRDRDRSSRSRHRSGSRRGNDERGRFLARPYRGPRSIGASMPTLPRDSRSRTHGLHDRRDGDRRGARHAHSMYPDRTRNRGSRRSRSPQKDKPKKKTQEEIKREQLEYQARVKEQLASIEKEVTNSDDEEALAAARRRRRLRLLKAQSQPSQTEVEKKEAVDVSHNGDHNSPATETAEEPAASSSSQSTDKDTDMGNGGDDDAEDDGVRNSLLLEKEDQNHKLCSTEATTTNKEEAAEDNDDGLRPHLADDIFGIGTKDKDAPAEDMFDMFNPNSKLIAPIDTKGASRAKLPTDNWDDSEGYYLFHPGDVLNGRYEVLAEQGKGVFSKVFRVRDKQAAPGEPQDLVVKIIRSNDVMFKAGHEEIRILKMLQERDPHNKKHCVRMMTHFEHRGHLCVVFEKLSQDLRELVKRLGGIGINVNAVQSYAMQLFTALRHLKKANLIHSDIKPDNILANEKKNILKLCDFGSATDVKDTPPTPYLCSRYYRAPEIMLGCDYGTALDVWSVGTVLFELYTGKIMFKGRTNNQMLHLFMQTRGRFHNKMLKRGQFTHQHFDENFVFELNKTDDVTGEEMKKKVHFGTAGRDLLQAMHPTGCIPLHQLSDDDRRLVLLLKDLIEKCLILDPLKRITPEEALRHPFLTSSAAAVAAAAKKANKKHKKKH